MKQITVLLLKIIVVLFIIFFMCQTISAKQTYTKYENKYHISRCFIKAYNEKSKKFNATEPDVKLLEKTFKKYQDPYLVIMIYELGSKKAKNLYDAGKYSNMAVEVCELSQYYESKKFNDNLRIKKQKKYLGTYTITAYCSCSNCCGKSDGITASGKRVKEGRTIACGSLPIGTKVYIDSVGTRTVEDRGVTGNWIDLYIDSHKRCLQFGLKKKKVYKIE